MVRNLQSPMSDEEDRRFMGALFLECRHIMFAEVSRLISNSWEAEDVIQNAIYRLCDKVELLRNLEKPQRIKYVVTTARNMAINSIRNMPLVTLYSLDDDSLNLSESLASSTDVESTVILYDQIRELASVWDKIDDVSKILLEGKYLLKKSDEELSEMLGIKSSSVRMMLTRSRRKALDLMTTSQTIV